MALVGNRIVVGGLPNDFLHPQAYPEYYAHYQEQLPYRGFKRALLSTMRRMPLTGMAATYTRVGQQDRPVLLLWGREDATIPLATAEQVRAALPQAAFHVIDAAGHNAEYERPEAVNPLLIDFLNG
jgi:pimeloyl-ACP methyl ester carboxylesterase